MHAASSGQHGRANGTRAMWHASALDKAFLTTHRKIRAFFDLRYISYLVIWDHTLQSIRGYLTGDKTAKHTNTIVSNLHKYARFMRQGIAEKWPLQTRFLLTGAAFMHLYYKVNQFLGRFLPIEAVLAARRKIDYENWEITSLELWRLGVNNSLEAIEEYAWEERRAWPSALFCM